MNTNQHTGRIVDELRFGAVSATLWANPTDTGERMTLTLKRSFLKAEGEWQESKMTLPLRDFLSAAEILRHMHGVAWHQVNASRAAAQEIPHEQTS